MAKAKIGDIEINVISSEVVNHAAETTDHAVEKGTDISDHTKAKLPTIEIVGAVMGDDASSKLEKLKKYQKEGKLVSFISRNHYNDMFILDIQTNHAAKIRNGFEFSITLKQLRIATAKEVIIEVVNPVTKVADVKTTTKVKAKVNNGKQQPKTNNKYVGGVKPIVKDNFGLRPMFPTPSNPINSRVNLKDLVSNYHKTPVQKGGTR